MTRIERAGVRRAIHALRLLPHTCLYCDEQQIVCGRCRIIIGLRNILQGRPYESITTGAEAP